MRIFEFDDYRTFLRTRISKMPNKGRGEWQRIAAALSMHTTSLSQVTKGQREFNQEQAQKLGEYFGLNELELDYLLALVHWERAGTDELRKTLRRQLTRMKAEAAQLVRRLPRDQILSEENKAVFYSSWYYSGIRLLCSLPNYGTVDSVSHRFRLPKEVVSRVIDFLLSCGLCIEESGQIRMGPKRTHLEASSPLVARHHTNWRLKAMERFERIDPLRELVFSAPMSLSKTDALRLREMFAKALEDATAVAAASESEKLYCLNLDWIEF